MGFVPIFITLGGFIFLFLILVNQNLKSKKKNYYTLLETLKGLVEETYPALHVEAKTDLKVLELQYRNARRLSETRHVDDSINNQIDARFAACKMARFQYQQLKDTKPYFFVARLFGHADI